jgi:hypothetical protein
MMTYSSCFEIKIEKIENRKMRFGLGNNRLLTVDEMNKL